jgi:hypothetical protein
VARFPAFDEQRSTVSAPAASPPMMSLSMVLFPSEGVRTTSEFLRPQSS